MRVAFAYTVPVECHRVFLIATGVACSGGSSTVFEPCLGMVFGVLFLGTLKLGVAYRISEVGCSVRGNER